MIYKIKKCKYSGHSFLDVRFIPCRIDGFCSDGCMEKFSDRLKIRLVALLGFINNINSKNNLFFVKAYIDRYIV